jgi:hypothetical protein
MTESVYRFSQDAISQRDKTFVDVLTMAVTDVFPASLRTTEDLENAPAVVGNVIRHFVFKHPLECKLEEASAKLRKIRPEKCPPLSVISGLVWEAYVFMLRPSDPFDVQLRPQVFIRPEWLTEIPDLVLKSFLAQTVVFKSDIPGLAFFPLRELTFLFNESLGDTTDLRYRLWVYAGDHLDDLLKLFLKLLVYMEKIDGDWPMWKNRYRDMITVMNLAMPRLPFD